MKDEKLEKEFDEYFKGLNKPEGITANAKKEVKKGRTNRAKILKFASLAACLLLVCTVTVLALRSNFRVEPPQNGVDSVPQPAYYSLSSLTASPIDAYAVNAKTSPELKPVTKLAYAENATVTDLTEYGKNGDRVIVKASAVVLDNGTRHDVTMFVEYTGDLCEDLKEIADGNNKYYNGVSYSHTVTYDDGEPVNSFSLTKKGYKYYVSVKSSDPSAYVSYIELIFS